jgi:hypothetical protein
VSVIGERAGAYPFTRPLLSLSYAEHFGFKLGAFLAEALICFEIYEAQLNKVDFGPTRAVGIEMPRRIRRVLGFAVNQEHATFLDRSFLG